MSLLTDAATEAVYPLLPVFLTRVLGAPPAALGLIEGAADATSSLLKVVAGRLSDRLRRRKPLVVAGYALSSLVRPLLAVTGAWPHVFAVRIADRVGKGLRGAPRDAILAAAAPAGERGRVFGFHWAMDHGGAAVGPILASAFLWFHPGEYRLLFALTLLPGLAAVATLTRVREERGHGNGEWRMANGEARAANGELSSESTAHALRHSPFAIRHSPVSRYLLILTLFTLGNSTDAFLLLRFADAGAPTVALPLIWSAQHALKAALSTRGGALSDRFGRPAVIATGWGIYALAYAAFAWTTSLPWLVWWFMVYGAYAAAVEGSEKALIADLAPADGRGAAFGWYAAVQGLGALAASVLFGLLYQTLGPAAAFLTGAGLALGAASWLLAERHALTLVEHAGR
ncbi:MAG: MFS transporter [Acidobacteriota bacterium]